MQEIYMDTPINKLVEIEYPKPFVIIKGPIPNTQPLWRLNFIAKLSTTDFSGTIFVPGFEKDEVEGIRKKGWVGMNRESKLSEVVHSKFEWEDCATKITKDNNGYIVYWMEFSSRMSPINEHEIRLDLGINIDYKNTIVGIPVWNGTSRIIYECKKRKIKIYNSMDDIVAFLR